MTEQIEMLKQQISVYADDFANERSDRERIQADREAQKERIKEYERDIPLLKEQVTTVGFQLMIFFYIILAPSLSLIMQNVK
jgi:chromosome segregation ATPase